MLGESLEQHCLSSFEQVRAIGFPRAYFEKDNDASGGSIPVILVGGHRSVENMEKVLNEGRIEALSLSRPLIREPELPNRWMRGDKAPARCVSCNMCYQTPAHACIFRRRGS